MLIQKINHRLIRKCRIFRRHNIDGKVNENFPIQNQTRSTISALKNLARKSVTNENQQRVRLEKCDLCNLVLAEEHQHLFEPIDRQLLCSCDACTILFSAEGAKYKRVPRRVRALKDFNLSDTEWNALLIPIGIAFFFYSTPMQKTAAFYPSPAGSVESLLELDAWQEIENANPVLKKMERDVEALLINRIGETREYFIVPIDECYKLVGLIRANWRGLSGGAEVWQAVEEFFENLRRKAS